MDSTVIFSRRTPFFEGSAVSRSTSGSRFQMWVDAVGGFLICLNSRVALGQAIPSANVDVPIVGDLSSRHAELLRQDGCYLLQPRHRVLLDGRLISEPVLLSEGDEIQLGNTVVLRFRQPHPLSSTARLEILSHHRTQPPADAILLMSDTCIIGPAANSHVICRDWSQEIVLFRRGEQFYCRSDASLEIDGRPAEKMGRLKANSRICGTDCCLSLEPLG